MRNVSRNLRRLSTWFLVGRTIRSRFFFSFFWTCGLGKGSISLGVEAFASYLQFKTKFLSFLFLQPSLQLLAVLPFHRALLALWNRKTTNSLLYLAAVMVFYHNGIEVTDAGDLVGKSHCRTSPEI